VLVEAVDVVIELVPARGSAAGLLALRDGAADAAAVHLWHRGGQYNDPLVMGVLAGRDPHLLHLWRREQGLILPAGNPDAVG
ncbi:substrate-binding domain-containing protein, partial [Streptomyces caeruleatus]